MVGATWKAPGSTTSAVDLSNIYSLVVGTPVALTGGVTAQGFGQTIRVYGMVSGDIAIAMTPAATANAANSLYVAPQGQVFSVSLYAMQLQGCGYTVNNYGQIEALDSTAVFIDGRDATASSTVNNFGEIVGRANAVAIAPDSTQTLELKNTGLIEGRSSAFYAQDTATAVVHITNSGQMIGDIHLAAGDDKYLGTKGSIDGEVHAGNGRDAIYGGLAAETLFGDAGNDTLYGGRGADQLSGGADADVFLYKSALDSRAQNGIDTILDFSPEQGDRIDLHVIDANVNIAGNQTFKFIGAAPFHKHAGELRAEVIMGETYVTGDTNGDGKLDFSIHIDGTVKMATDYFIL